MSQHDIQPAKTVAWFKHGPYSDGEELQCVFEDPNDDINYSALIFKDPELQPATCADVLDRMKNQAESVLNEKE